MRDHAAAGLRAILILFLGKRREVPAPQARISFCTVYNDTLVPWQFNRPALPFRKARDVQPVFHHVRGWGDGSGFPSARLGVLACVCLKNLAQRSAWL